MGRKMDHKAFVAQLPMAVKSQLTERSDRAGLLHLAGHVGLIFLCAALIASGVSGWWALLPVQGVLIVFLFTLEHEATHKTPFANDALNEWAGRICGVLLILPFEWFRYFHLAHHRWTNIAGKDPELAGAKPATRRAWAWHISGIPYWIAGLRLVKDLALGRCEGDFLPSTSLPRIIFEARMLALIYTAAAISLLFSPILLWIWILPVLLGQPALRLYLLAEHGDCPQVTDMFQNTRTTFTTRLMRFLAWNMPFHVEHHVYPSVPFHRLPQLHDLMKDNLQVTAQGYRAFTRAYLSRRR